MNRPIFLQIATISIVTSLLSLTPVSASNNAVFQNINPTWITPGFSGDFAQELFVQSNQKILLSQPALGYPYETTSMLLEISVNGALTPINSLKYPRNYSASIVGQIGPELFIVDEFFNGAPADDPDRMKMSNWQYPWYQKYFIKNLAGQNVSLGLDKNRIQKLVKPMASRLLTTTVIKGDSPPAIGEKPQYIHKFQLLNSTNFADPFQIWESQVFESERNPDWNPFIFPDDSVILGIEVPAVPVNTRCGKLISLNSVGKSDSLWQETINSLLKNNPKTKDLALVGFNTKPLKLNEDVLAFKMSLSTFQSLCRSIDTQAFLITDYNGRIKGLSVPDYPIFENWKKRDVIWVNCKTLDRCLNLDASGKVFWTDQKLQDVSNPTYYQLIPPDNLLIDGTSYQPGAGPLSRSPVNSTVKDWSAQQFLFNSGQVIGLMRARPNLQNDRTLAIDWNSNFVASFLMPDVPKINKIMNSTTCVKGKTIKRLTGSNTTCPKGYKKK